MKKHLLVSTLFCVLMSAAAIGETPIYATGFESNEGFQIGPMGPETANWATVGPYAFAVNDGSNYGRDGQILESTAPQSDEGSRLWLSGVDFRDANKVVVELDMLALPSGGSGYQANLQLGDFPEKPKTGMVGTAAQISLRGSGRVVAFDGENEKEIGRYVPGEWVKLRIEADHSSKTYSVTVDNGPPAANLNFRDPEVVRSQSLGFTHYSGTNVEQPFAMALDNLKIYEP